MEATATELLRKLDALFAERVLGHVVRTATFTKPVTQETYEDFCYDVPEQQLTWILPTYTRSLDAAWEGLPKEYVVSIHHRGDTFTCYKDNAVMTQLFEGTAAHPAEALVLACLRAVGVSEEDLS